MTLIEQAYATPCTRWFEIEALIEQAPDAETAEKLTCIRNSKYHQEEGLLDGCC